MSGGAKLDLTSNGVVRDMLFVRAESFTRFAFGSAGVMCTVDGIRWQTLLNAVALGGCRGSGLLRWHYQSARPHALCRVRGAQHPSHLRSSRPTGAVAARFLAARPRRNP